MINQGDIRVDKDLPLLSQDKALRPSDNEIASVHKREDQDRDK